LFNFTIIKRLIYFAQSFQPRRRGTALKMQPRLGHLDDYVLAESLSASTSSRPITPEEGTIQAVRQKRPAKRRLTSEEKQLQRLEESGVAPTAALLYVAAEELTRESVSRNLFQADHTDESEQSRDPMLTGVSVPRCFSQGNPSRDYSQLGPDGLPVLKKIKSEKNIKLEKE
jgi:hypothetical protein